MASITHHTQTVVSNDPTKAISATAWNEGHDIALVDADIPATIARDAEVAAGYQPLDSDLTSIAALTTTAFGRTFLDLVDAAAARTKLALGSLATASSIAHSATTGQTANDHHNQSHNHSAAGDGTALVPATFTIPGGPKLAAGTSFPGSPATNDLFFRTDRSLEYVWDGTRWLCTCLHTETFGALAALAATGVSTDILPGDLAVAAGLYLIEFEYSFAVTGGTALSGSHKWDIDLKSFVGNTGTTRATLSINSGASSIWRGLVTTTVATALDGIDLYQVAATKTGTPGTLDGKGRLAYRRIG